MANSVKKTAVARQVELVIRQLSSLSTLPQVAAEFLTHLANRQLNIPAISQIIESDPALASKIFSLAYKEGLVFPDDKPSVSQALAKLSTATIRDGLLSVKVFQAFDDNYDPDRDRLLPRKQLALHALATACCAKDIAEIALAEDEGAMAFSAGLLHDIGKLAIDEVMPKSFEKIVKEARTQNASIVPIEQKHLALDHTVIGKRLAEKWHLPQEIVFAIWLHHSDTEIISENMPAGKIAQVVRLADVIARQCNIGISGSFDEPASVEEIVRSLSLSNEQVDRIRQDLPGRVSQRSEVLGLEAASGPAAYCELISETAGKLAHDNTELTEAGRRSATCSAHMDFINEFILTVDSEMSAVDIAAGFAGLWQKHYQTGPVCVYLQANPDESLLDMVTVDNDCRTNTTLLNAPAEAPAIPAQVHSSFEILNAADRFDWIGEQVDFDIDISRAKLAPLLASGRAIGAIIFEHRLPVDPAEQSAMFEVSTSIAAAIIALTFVSKKQTQLAEQFAELLAELKQTRDELAEAKSLGAIAAMAAGAAHELNNPLAVISGRAQLLLEAETDNNKKQMLEQIQQRATEISQMVTDLMSFAEPTEPEPRVVSVPVLIDAAIRQTTAKHDLDQMETEFDQIDPLNDVFVDSKQIASAIAEVLSNALESYRSPGPVKITGKCRQGEGFVAFEVIDNGCGMDPETLQKAAQPFFSAKPAGRKRGMGLTRAKRLIQLNKGDISLQSTPDHGTTITIKLPRA